MAIFIRNRTISIVIIIVIVKTFWKESHLKAEGLRLQHIPQHTH
jgi:hypothetical protein